jgi:D-amino peptidase
MEYLIACDLEGIHGVVGEPYKGLLTSIPDYQVAVTNAEKEINAVAKALFDCGATKVVLWDNHGGMVNVNQANIDSRVQHVDIEAIRRQARYEFVKEHNFAGILYLGYHSREGTLNGVLAHTYSSVDIQYVKINGKAVGELEIDSYICAKYGIPTIFIASDDICVSQFKETVPNISSVVNKIAKGRNAADFIDEDKVLQDLYSGVCEAVKQQSPIVSVDEPINLEIRYTRTERAVEKIKLAQQKGTPVKYGDDAHILLFEVDKIDDVTFFM